MRLRGDRGVSRRDFVATAVAIGGSAALSACLDTEGGPTDATPTETGLSALSVPNGSPPEERPPSQHVWNRYLVHDAHGNTVLPSHQLVLGLAYEGSIPPTDEERAAVTDAMDTLDRAFQWGTGGPSSTAVNEGLLTLLGYAPRYFERMGGRVEGLLAPEEVLEAVGEDPAKVDGFDAMLVLNSDFGSVLLAAEAALFGERSTLNGVDVEGTFEGVFSVAGRRTGVVGRGLPREVLDNDDVPREAPLSMGFRSGFADNQASEEQVTIDDGPFAGGTTLQASRVRIDLDRWYDQDAGRRMREMFSPTVDEADVGPIGDRLGSESRVDESATERIESLAEEHGVVGHSQKVARARGQDFEPKLLRRTEGVASDVPEGSALNFNSLQRDVAHFVEARRAMNADEYDVDVPAERHGIVDYLETRARGTYLVPPRPKRALPTP